MRGQKNIIECAKSLIDSKSYPRFSIFIGRNGSGRKTLAKEIAKLLGIDFVVWDTKVDDIRELIKFMWDNKQGIMYCLPNYEDMSMGARNALLKVCEEPPNNAYIVMTAASRDIILPTILNRGTVFELSGYTEEELRCIELDNNKYESDDDLNKVIQLCEVPGDLEIVRGMDVDEFTEFMKLFWGKIGKSSAGNALKISSKIRIKEDSTESTLYDLGIFINYLMTLNRTEEDIKVRSEIFKILLEAKKNIQLKYNKLFILDNLILEIRRVKGGAN